MARLLVAFSLIAAGVLGDDSKKNVVKNGRRLLAGQRRALDAQDAFAMADVNSDGVLTREEFNAPPLSIRILQEGGIDYFPDDAPWNANYRTESPYEIQYDGPCTPCTWTNWDWTCPPVSNTNEYFMNRHSDVYNGDFSVRDGVIAPSVSGWADTGTCPPSTDSEMINVCVPCGAPVPENIYIKAEGDETYCHSSDSDASSMGRRHPLMGFYTLPTVHNGCCFEMRSDGTAQVDNDPVTCHPASTLVATPAGSKRIDELEIGDAILGPSGQSLVLGFLHRSPTLTDKYRTLATASGTVSMSPEHMLPVNGVNARADTAKVDDTVSTNSGPALITAITNTYEPGAYHLFSESEYYYAKDPGSDAWYATSNMLLLDDDGTYTDISAWYAKAKECYAAGRPMNAAPEVAANMTKSEFYDCANFPLVPGLAPCATCA